MLRNRSTALLWPPLRIANTHTSEHASFSRCFRRVATGAATPACDPPSAIPLQLQLHIVHILESFVRIFRHTRFHYPVHPPATPAAPSRWAGISFQHRGNDARRGFAFKRSLSSCHLIQHSSERKDILKVQPFLGRRWTDAEDLRVCLVGWYVLSRET